MIGLEQCERTVAVATEDIYLVRGVVANDRIKYAVVVEIADRETERLTATGGTENHGSERAVAFPWQHRDGRTIEIIGNQIEYAIAIEVSGQYVLRKPN